MRRAPALVILLSCGVWVGPPSLSTLAGDTPQENRAASAAPLSADSSSAAPSSARSLAERVLMAEANGDLEERSRLMLDLLEQDRQSAAEHEELRHALAGELQGRDGWKNVDGHIEANQQLPALDRYERMRSRQSDTVAGHVQIAQWCRQAGLDVQAAAHWRRVLQLDPSNLVARQALGHRLVQGEWLTPEQVRALETQMAAFQSSWKKYGKELQQIAAGMAAERPGEREAAVQDLLEIDAAEAIPAVDAIFSTAGRPLIDRAIDWLIEIRDPAAAEVLARWSIDHPEESVRELCAEALRPRPRHHYVPLLLERTRTPLVSSIVPSFRPDGSLAGVRHIFSREVRDRFEVAVHDSVQLRQWTIQRADDIRSRRSGNDLDQAIDEARLERDQQIRNALREREIRAAATQAALQRSRAAAAENEITETINQRVRMVLSKSSGTDPESSLPQLWDWWASYTEREPAPMKLASYRYQLQFAASPYYSTTPPPTSPPAPRAKECFVAGTLVVTARGEKPIESLLVGDRVLSKNIETGELVWDVVLTKTEQPAAPLLNVSTNEDDFQCTGGHLFWVSGKGWTKASDLKYGDLLHGLSRPSLVQSVEAADAAPTYNLVTAQHHNYFVGHGRALSHDFDEQRPTAVRVPGLTLASDR